MFSGIINTLSGIHDRKMLAVQAHSVDNSAEGGFLTSQETRIIRQSC